MFISPADINASLDEDVVQKRMQASNCKCVVLSFSETDITPLFVLELFGYVYMHVANSSRMLKQSTFQILDCDKTRNEST